MKKIEAKIVADSISEQGHRITSMLLTYPRFIHGEVMTHRLFSRNSASSRAIPFEKMVQMVEEEPFIPVAWQKSHKGMQGTEYWDKEESDKMNLEWLQARNKAIYQARMLHYAGVTKQLCNRLLEPFMWHTVLVTATEWENFFGLRCPKYEYYLESYGEEPEIREYFRSRKDMIAEWGDTYVKDLNQTRPRRKVKDFEDIHWFDCNHSQAEIHIQALAEAIWDAMNDSTPKKLEAEEWHIPFGDRIDVELLGGVVGKNNFKSNLNNALPLSKALLKVATARCARLSYMTHEGEIDYEKDIRLHDQLLNDGHMSPFEHCTKAMNDYEYDTKFFKQHSGIAEDGWCNNFRGWIQYRYLVEPGI